MVFRPFFQRFPDLAREETRNIVVLSGDDSLPEGTYCFIELFCNDADCDCRRVFIQVARGRGRALSPPLATISFGWEDEDFYRNWGSAPRSQSDVDEMKGPVLARLAPQSEYAPALLQQLKTLVEDESYVECIARRYRLYRDAIDVEPSRPPRSQARSAPGRDRNRPCPCGSGRKLKKCCWGNEASPAEVAR